MLDPTTDAGWKKKLEAAARFEALGWPSTKLEAWRYFSTRSLEDLDLTTPPATQHVPLPPLPSPRVVFVDGRFAPHLLALEGLDPEAFTVRALSDYSDAERLAAISRLTPDDGALEQANLAFLTDGVHVVARGQGEAPPLHIVHLTTGAGVTHSRTVLEVERHARLAVLVHHLGLGPADGRYLHNAVTEVHLADGAALSLGKHLAERADGHHVEALHCLGSRDSRFSSFTLSLGGARVRTALHVHLAGAGAACQVDGLYLGAGHSVLDHLTDVHHEAPHTSSAETWAGVLDGHATGTFQGRVQIAAGAIKSQTRQLTRTLLLSDGATANAKPELRIDCDDVAASHGASVGRLDPTQRFYLESRGLSPEEATTMLVAAFARRVLADAPSSLRAALTALVDARLDAGDRSTDEEGGS